MAYSGIFLSCGVFSGAGVGVSVCGMTDPWQPEEPNTCVIAPCQTRTKGGTLGLGVIRGYLGLRYVGTIQGIIYTG